MAPKLTAWIDWLATHVNVVLLAVLLIVTGTWAFIALADEVKEGGTQRFDEWAVRSLRQPNPGYRPTAALPEVPLGPRWLWEVGRDITALGGVTVLTMVTAAVAGYLLMARKYHAMWLVLIATTGGFLLSAALKGLIARPRPDVAHYMLATSPSFPSGHSMMSAVVYLTLGSLLTRLAARRRVKLYFLAVAMLLTFVVGISRIYMGVHYPTDVLAGWTAGLVWALGCWLIARYLQRRGAVETDAA